MKYLIALLVKIFTFESVVRIIFQIFKFVLTSFKELDMNFKAKRFTQGVYGFLDAIGYIWVRETKTDRDDTLYNELMDLTKALAEKHKFDLPEIPAIK